MTDFLAGWHGFWALLPWDWSVAALARWTGAAAGMVILTVTGAGIVEAWKKVWR